MNLCWIPAFPHHTLETVLRNDAWEEKDYAYREIIWNYRRGLSSFGIMLSKYGWVVVREDKRRWGENNCKEGENFLLIFFICIWCFFSHVFHLQILQLPVTVYCNQ